MKINNEKSNLERDLIGFMDKSQQKEQILQLNEIDLRKDLIEQENKYKKV